MGNKRQRKSARGIHRCWDTHTCTHGKPRKTRSKTKQKPPRQSMMRQKKKCPKISGVSFALPICAWAGSLPLSMVYLPSERLLKETNYAFASGDQLRELEARDGDCVYFPSQHWVPIWFRPCAGPGHAATVSVVHAGPVPLCLEGPLSLVSSFPDGSRSLSASWCIEVPEPWTDDQCFRPVIYYRFILL